MNTVIIYVDDAVCARQVLEPAMAAAPAGSTHWVVVACAPRMTHRVSKWVSHSARESWRTKWADRLFDGLAPLLNHPQHRVTPVLARGPLEELTQRIQQDLGPARMLDARRTGGQPGAKSPASEPTRARWMAPGTLGGWLAGVGVLIALAGE